MWSKASFIANMTRDEIKRQFYCWEFGTIEENYNKLMADYENED